MSVKTVKLLILVRDTLTKMFIAVVMQLRGFACGVILTVHSVSASLSVGGAGVPPSLDSSMKPCAPMYCSSTRRYLSIVFPYLPPSRRSTDTAPLFTRRR